MFLFRGVGQLNVLCEAQMCGQSLGVEGHAPSEHFRKPDALRSILVQTITLHCSENDCLDFSGFYPCEIVQMAQT